MKKIHLILGTSVVLLCMVLSACGSSKSNKFSVDTDRDHRDKYNPYSEYSPNSTYIDGVTPKNDIARKLNSMMESCTIIGFTYQLENAAGADYKCPSVTGIVSKYNCFGGYLENAGEYVCKDTLANDGNVHTMLHPDYFVVWECKKSEHYHCDLD